MPWPLVERLPWGVRKAVLFTVLPVTVVVYGLVGRCVQLALVLAPRQWQRRIVTRMASAWGGGLLTLLCGLGLLKLEVIGRPPPAGARVAVANHQSLLDIVVLLGVLRRHRVRFVLKRELKWGIPNVSPGARLAGFAFVDRRPAARAENLLALERFTHELEEDGATGVIFPEGTWEPRGEPLPFRPAGLKALLRRGSLDVLPVCIEGTWRAQRFRDLWRGLDGLRVSVHIEPPIPAAEAGRSPEQTVSRLERLLHTRLRELRTRAETAKAAQKRP